MAGDWARTTHAQNAGSQESERQPAAEPTHGSDIADVLLVSNTGAQPLEEDCGSWTGSTRARKDEWCETAVVNFTDTLLVNSALLRFALAVELLQGQAAVRAGMGVEHSNIKICHLMPTAAPESTGFDIKPSSFLLRWTCCVGEKIHR